MAHRIDTSTAQKDKFGVGKNGFTRGNPQTGVPATELDDDYFDMLQEEIIGIVEAAGDTLDKTRRNQLHTALNKLFQTKTGATSALGALIPAANLLPYFTGASGASLTELTTVGRDILASATKAAVLEYLGIAEATTSQKGIVKLNGGVTNADDTLAATSGAVKIAYDLALSAYQASAISLGKGQLLQNMTSARVLGATYTNNTGYPIAVYIRVTGGTSSNIYVYVNDIEFGGGGSTASQVSIATAFFVVPPGATYRTTAPGVSLSVWSELR